VPPPHATTDLCGQLHSRFSRLLAAALVGISRASLVIVALAGMFGASGVFTPAVLAPIAILSGLPAVAAWLLERFAAARLTVIDGGLVLQRPDLAIEVSRAELAGVVPWTVPLPGPGLAVVLRSGRRLPHGFETADPGVVLTALGDEGGRQDPIVAWARARAAEAPWYWHHLLWKFVGFALLPTAVLFNAHQHIAYGGTWGQYYLEGGAAYLRTFALYWLMVSVYLVLWASVWRAAAECVTLAAAVFASSHATRVRRAVEVACRVLFYAGVPALVVVRFLA